MGLNALAQLSALVVAVLNAHTDPLGSSPLKSNPDILTLSHLLQSFYFITSLFSLHLFSYTQYLFVFSTSSTSSLSLPFLLLASYNYYSTLFIERLNVNLILLYMKKYKLMGHTLRSYEIVTLILAWFTQTEK